MDDLGERTEEPTARKLDQSRKRGQVPKSQDLSGAITLLGGLLVFVDVMKELPMTLLLRPFDFETLATYTYQFAKDEMLEEAALPALMIVIAGLLPVILMNRMLRRTD